MPAHNRTETYPFTSTLRLSATLIKVGLRLRQHGAAAPVDHDAAAATLVTRFAAALLVLAGILIQFAVTPAAFLQARDRAI